MRHVTAPSTRPLKEQPRNMKKSQKIKSSNEKPWGENARKAAMQGDPIKCKINAWDWEMTPGKNQH